MMLDLKNLPYIENLPQLAEFIGSLPANDDADAVAGLDMHNADLFMTQRTNHPCGTAACIGGWLEACNKPKERQRIDCLVAELGKGVSLSEANKLCFEYPADPKPNPQQAARAIMILHETGKCDWSRAMGEVPA
jgi:hypothetical protein